MAFQLLKPEEVATSQLARVGIYGQNGVGKTTFLSTVPASLPMLVVSADEENVKPLRGLAHVRVAKIATWGDVCEVFLHIQRAVDANKCPFKVIAFDTWSRIQALVLNHVVGYEIAKPGHEADMATQVPKTPKGFDQWQAIGALAGQWMRYFMRLPLHTIFLFQEVTRTPKFDNDILETGPALTPSALITAKEALEIIGRMYVVEDKPQEDDLGTLANASLRSINAQHKEKRMLLVGKHERYFTKGPTHQLGYVVEDPSWSKLAAAILAAPES